MAYYRLWNKDNASSAAAFQTKTDAENVRDLFNERYESEYKIEKKHGKPPSDQQNAAHLILSWEAENL